MSSDPGKKVRDELLRLLDDVAWRIAKSARGTAYPILQAMGQRPTDCAIIDYIVRLLQTGFPFHEVPLGEPPGSLGTGYVMNNADGRGLYIKVKIERERADEVVILSFHVSDHYKG